MAVVCALRFDDKSGAVVTDEEYWYLRRRKSYFADNIHNLLTDEIAAALKMEAVYASYGYPAFHHVVVQETRKHIQELFKRGPSHWKEGESLRDIRQIGLILLGHIHAEIRRRVNDTLKLLYGFTREDFTRGFFEENSRKYEINQEGIKDKARKLMTFSDKNAAMKHVFENKGVLMGYDQEHGISAYHYNSEKGIMAHISGGFETIGRGDYASGMEFARFINSKYLDKRRKGWDRTEGLVQTLKATMRAGEYFHEAGGCVSIALIDADEKKQEKRYRDITDDRARLLMEIVKGYDWNLIEKEDAYELVAEVAYRDGDIDGTEARMFQVSKNEILLKRLLRGYKLDVTEPGFQMSGYGESKGDDKKVKHKKKETRSTKTEKKN